MLKEIEKFKNEINKEIIKIGYVNGISGMAYSREKFNELKETGKTIEFIWEDVDPRTITNTVIEQFGNIALLVKHHRNYQLRKSETTHFVAICVENIDSMTVKEIIAIEDNFKGYA